MSWKEMSAMEKRKKFCLDMLKGEESVSELCRRHDISRPTGYKWFARFMRNGENGLEDLSRAPHANPRCHSEDMRELFLSARGLHPRWGPKKLLAWLQCRNRDVERWPCPSTVGEWLKSAGLVISRRRRNHASPTRSGLTKPDKCNRVWYTDFKGWFRLGNGRRCDPLTISEGYSRYLLRCQGYHGQKTEDAKRLFRAVFEEFGLPEVIRSDNGIPFASVGLGGLSRLSTWWMKLGIVPERIEPGKPYQNGSHERMHRTLKEETQKPPERNLRSQQRRFDAFREEYNEERPHEALGQRPPKEFYEPSPRLYPSREPEPEYPSVMKVRRVRHNGEIKWRGQYLYVTGVLTGEPVGLEQEDERYWTLYFCDVPLAIVDDEKMELLTPKSKIWKKFHHQQEEKEGCGNDVL